MQQQRSSTREQLQGQLLKVYVLLLLLLISCHCTS
jgi:hypothetical protein